MATMHLVLRYSGPVEDLHKLLPGFLRSQVAKRGGKIPKDLVRWKGDNRGSVTLNVKGRDLTGQFEIVPDHVFVDVDLPMFASLFGVDTSRYEREIPLYWDRYLSEQVAVKTATPVPGPDIARKNRILTSSAVRFYERLAEIRQAQETTVAGILDRVRRDKAARGTRST